MDGFDRSRRLMASEVDATKISSLVLSRTGAISPTRRSRPQNFNFRHDVLNHAPPRLWKNLMSEYLMYISMFCQFKQKDLTFFKYWVNRMSIKCEIFTQILMTYSST